MNSAQKYKKNKIKAKTTVLEKISQHNQLLMTGFKSFINFPKLGIVIFVAPINKLILLVLVTAC